MDAAGSGQRHDRGGNRAGREDHAAERAQPGHRAANAGGETIQFGGLPIRWPFGAAHLPRALAWLRGAGVADAGSSDRGRRERRLAVTAALISLAVGLIAGFAAGHFTAPPGSSRTAPPASRPAVAPRFLTTVISPTGERCAVEVGNDLELGIQIMNEARSPVTLGRIRAQFPLGGLRAISGAVGPCGALPGLLEPTPLSPGGTEWIVAKVAVQVPCPQPLPVWFEVDYAMAGKTTTVVLAGFPDLGPVSYRHCPTTEAPSVFSPRGDVDPDSGHSYGG